LVQTPEKLHDSYDTPINKENNPISGDPLTYWENEGYPRNIKESKEINPNGKNVVEGEFEIDELQNSLSQNINTEEAQNILYNVGNIEIEGCPSCELLTPEEGKKAMIEENKPEIYPNPSGGPVTIKLVTPLPQQGTLTVYNIGGQKVSEKPIASGTKKVIWKPDERVASGVYIYSIYSTQFEPPIKGKITRVK